MVDSTVGTIPLPHMQRQSLNNVTTSSTALRTGKPTVDLYQRSPVPLGFVFQLPYHVTPTGIANRAGKLGMFDHSLHSQRLNNNRLVLTNQSSCQLVQMVLSGVGNLLVDSGHVKSRFLSIASPLLLAIQCLLRPSQLFVSLVKMLGVGNLFACTQGDKTANPHIQAYSVGGRWQGQMARIVKPQADVPLPRRIQANSNGGWLNTIWQLPRPSDIQWLGALCQNHLAVFPPEGRLSKFCTTAVALLFEVGIFRPTCKEVTESGLQMPQSLLQRNAADLVEKLQVILLFPRRQRSGSLYVGHALLLPVPCARPQRQGFVIDEAYAPQCPA